LTFQCIHVAGRATHLYKVLLQRALWGRTLTRVTRKKLVG